MSTIEIFQEQAEASNVAYRALYRDFQAVGNTPGAALDALERVVATHNGQGNGTVVVIQRFRPDAFFTSRQQIRLRELMERFHAQAAIGKELSQKERKELEILVDAEWQAAIQRADEIIKETTDTKEKSGQAGKS